jgi:hypothetical protein
VPSSSVSRMTTDSASSRVAAACSNFRMGMAVR